MIFEAAAYFMNRRNQPVNESYVNEEQENISSSTTGGFFGILYMIMMVVYFVTIFILWGRLVYKAFKCSIKQGFSSIILPVHYNLYKFGDLISVSCDKN
jgi:hypothetical protein